MIFALVHFKMDGGPQRLYNDSPVTLYYSEGATHMTGFPEELLPVVNQHWANFGPQSQLIRHFLGITYFILTFVNFFANFLVIYVYLRVKELRTPVRIISI